MPKRGCAYWATLMLCRSALIRSLFLYLSSNNSTAWAIFAITSTPNGQRSMHAPHSVQSEAPAEEVSCERPESLVLSNSANLPSEGMWVEGEVFMPEQENRKLRQGFKVEKVVSGLSLPVNLAFVRNPKKTWGVPLFSATEFCGAIGVVTYVALH